MATVFCWFFRRKKNETELYQLSSAQKLQNLLQVGTAMMLRNHIVQEVIAITFVQEIILSLVVALLYVICFIVMLMTWI